MRNALLLTVLFFAAALIGSPQMPDERLTPRLLDTGPAERFLARAEVIEQRKAMISELIALAEQPDIDRRFKGPLHLSIELLGELRAEEAVDTLTKLLAYIPEGFETEESIPSEMYHVAAAALRRIGTPAISRMMALIENSDDADQRNLATWVVMEIDGKEQADFRFVTRARREKTDVASHFEEAADFVKSYQPVMRHPDEAKRRQP